MEEVVLVDSTDQAIGKEEKLSAHLQGKLHRALSVFLFNSKGEMLLQQRAFEKYHSGGLWTNACCSHPRAGEDVLAAAKRRLMEEIGVSCELKKSFDFIYRATLDRGIIEHEFDHVFTGIYDGALKLNPKEVFNSRWVDIKSLEDEIEKYPEQFTYWFKEIMRDQKTLILAAHQGLKPALPYS